MRWNLKKKQTKLKMKKTIFLLFGIILILSFLNLISASDQPTQVFSKIFLNPFYTSSTTQNVNTSFSIIVNPPDKVSSVVSAIINFDVWLNPSVTFRLWVNNQPCNNPVYYVSTTYASAGKNLISFDCSNVISQAGNYIVTLKSDKDTGAITGWLDLTYMSNPRGELALAGTEYSYGQTAKEWLQLKDNNGLEVNNGICYLDVLYPNMSKLINEATMNNLNYEGIYYYDLVVPQIEGVYPAIAKCYYTAYQFPKYASDYRITSGVLKSGTIANTYSLDTNYLVFTTNKNGGLTANNRVNVTFNFSDFYANCGNVSEVLTQGLTIYWNGIWNTGTAGHDITFSIFNYTSNSWIDFSNKLLGGSGGSTLIVTNSMLMNNFTNRLGINASNHLKIKLADNDINEGVKDISTDLLYASCNQLANAQWQEIKGSAELHVTNINRTAEAVWNWYSRNLTFTADVTNYTRINDIVNYTKINELIQNRNDIVNYSLIMRLINNRTDIVNYTLVNQLIQNRNDVTNYTLINQLIHTLDVSDKTNYTLINNLVHSLNITDLTNYTLINQMIQTINVSDKTNYTLINQIVQSLNVSDKTNYTLINNLIHSLNITDLTNYTLINNLIQTIDVSDKTNYTLINNLIHSLNVSDKTDYTLINQLIQNRNDVVNYTFINELIYGRNDIVNYTKIDGLIQNRNDIVNYTLINQLIHTLNITDMTNYTLINGLIQNRNDIVNYTLIMQLIENQTRVDMTNYTHIGFSVWNWVGSISSNILTAFTNAIIQPVASAVWNFAGGRNLTYTEDVTNYSKVAEYVWLYENKSLTFYQVNNISVEQIWGYMNRSLSFYPEVVEVNYSLIAEYNWNYVGRNLTFENINNLSVAEIWSYYNRSLSDNIPLQIWSYPDRNLTTDIPFEVWNYDGNRTLTYYTINLTELIEMINAYDFTQTPIPYTTENTYTNYELNVTLMIQK